MTEIFGGILRDFQNSASLFFLVFLRVGAFASLLPGFGEQSVPARIKVLLAISLSVIVFPLVADGLPELTGKSFHLAIVYEVMTGLFLGVSTRLFVIALQTAGTIAAQSTSLSQIFGGSSVDPIPALGYIIVVAAIALAMIFDLHIVLSKFLVASFQFFPVGSYMSGAAIIRTGVQYVTDAFELAVLIAAPFLLVSTLYNLMLGAVNRAMPQLMVAFIGAPFITFAGLVILFVTLPFILNFWLEAFFEFLSRDSW